MDVGGMSPMFIRLCMAAAGLLSAVVMVGCAGNQPIVTTATVATTTVTTTTVTTLPETSSTVSLEPIVVPTLPSEIPGYAQVDPATGLHMTGTPKVIDVESYRLTVSGKVARELSLSYDDLRRLPKVTATPKLVCVAGFEDVATWSGVPLATILDLAGVQPDAEEIEMKGADDYSVHLRLDKARDPENFLAYEWSGRPVPVLHGFPLRAVIPAQFGLYWVKWLVEIVVG